MSFSTLLSSILSTLTLTLTVAFIVNPALSIWESVPGSFKETLVLAPISMVDSSIAFSKSFLEAGCSNPAKLTFLKEIYYLKTPDQLHFVNRNSSINITVVLLKNLQSFFICKYYSLGIVKYKNWALKLLH